MKEQIFATDKFNSQNPITRKSSLLHNMRLCSFIWSPYNLHNLNFQYNTLKILKMTQQIICIQRPNILNSTRDLKRVYCETFS